MQTISVRKYKHFSEISKDNPEMGDAEINSNDVLSVFQNIFCNNPFQDHSKAHIWVNLEELHAAIGKF